MSVKTPRQYLVDHLQPLLPKRWKLVPFQTSLDVVDRPVVMLKMQTVKRSPQAPQGQLSVEYIVTIIEPRTDPGPAETALDEKVLDLMYALRQVPGVLVGDANAVLFGDTNLAYDISIEVLSTPPTPLTP